MVGLYFLILFAVGILRPIRNTLALDGLAASEFYKVYLVSAVVIFFVWPYNRLADRFSWRILIPAVAAFFALNLLVFRALYEEGSTAFGVVFYGWYDLFAAVLVTQFFMAVQVFFNSRDAKSAIPLVIIGGSVGATLGGFTVGVLAEGVGTPNLMLLAAFFILAFAAALPFVWAGYPPIKAPGRTVKAKGLSTSEFVRVFSNPHIRLIASLVLVTVVVKTMVDYEFNEAVGAYAGDRDSIGAFQGFVLGATQWLPIAVLVFLGPLLKRWGVGTAVLMLPVVMLFSTVGLAIAFSVWTAVIAKAADTTFRYSSERTGREILYVPVPTELKLRAKAYVDMAIEKGLGKVTSAVLIMIFVSFMDYRKVAWVAAGISLLWIAGTLAVKREYVRTLARSIEGRFASLQGGFASLSDASTLPLVQKALTGGDTLQTVFALDLVRQGGGEDARRVGAELETLLGHDSPDVRSRALDVVGRYPGVVGEDAVRDRVGDEDRRVREGAVRALCAGRPLDGAMAIRELLTHEERRVRMAILSCLSRGEVESSEAPALVAEHVRERGEGMLAGDADAREELALTLGVAREDGGPGLLDRLIEDPEPRVARAALLSAGRVGRPDLQPRLIRALGRRELREAARDALVAQGVEVVDVLEAWMNDPSGDLAVRRNIPLVMARMPEQGTVGALLESLREPDTDRVIDYRTLKALNKLRARSEADLTFEPMVVLAVARREVERAQEYARARHALERIGAGGPGVELLGKALAEAWEECRESVFRCLGLIHDPRSVFRCYLCVCSGDGVVRANALEWLEQTLGHALYERIAPVLSPPGPPQRAQGEKLPTLSAVLTQQAEGRNAWLALVAVWILNERRSGGQKTGEETMDLIEKVFLLGNVDLLHDAKSDHLALLASIAEEVEMGAGEILIRQGEPNDTLYVLIQGSVELRGMGDQTLVARENTPFGTWALIDSDPSVVGARTLEPSRMLRITRSDFHDLLADHPELAMGMLQGLARRVRKLVA